jgi:hypothetical protein
MTTAACAVLMQLGKGKQAFRWVWIIPITYAVIAGIEALMAGSFVGLMFVPCASCVLLYEAWLTTVKSRSSVQCRLLSNVDMDTLRMVTDQCFCSYSSLILYSRWPMMASAPISAL